MVFGVSQNVFSNSVLLMFGAWQMEIPPGYNFLLFPIGRLWERAGEGCSACSSDLSSSHWILALRCKRIIGWPGLMRVQFKALTSSTRIRSFSELYNQTLESVIFFFFLTLEPWNSSGFYIWFRIFPSLKILRGKAASEWMVCYDQNINLYISFLV